MGTWKRRADYSVGRSDNYARAPARFARPSPRPTPAITRTVAGRPITVAPSPASVVGRTNRLARRPASLAGTSDRLIGRSTRPVGTANKLPGAQASRPDPCAPLSELPTTLSDR